MVKNQYATVPINNMECIMHSVTFLQFPTSSLFFLEVKHLLKNGLKHEQQTVQHIVLYFLQERKTLM